MKREATLLAVAAATATITVATTLGRATGRSPSACLPRGANVIAEDNAGTVYTSGTTVYACSAYTGGRTKLGATGIVGPGATRVGPVALAGPYVVYGTHTMGVDTGGSAVLLRRLSTGKVISTASAFPTTLGPESTTSIDAIVAPPSGAYAWTVSGESIVRANSFDVGVYEANAQPHAGSVKLLDQGRRIAPMSLRLHGSVLSWKHGSTTRHATLK